MSTEHCWYCSIPQLTVAKLALLNCWMWFDLGTQQVYISHPQLAAAERYRESRYNLSVRNGYKGMPGNPTPIKYQWVLPNWRAMKTGDWDAVTTDIAEQISKYHWSFLP